MSALAEASRGPSNKPPAPKAAARLSQVRVSPARAAAFEILGLVGQGRGHSDELLHGRHLKTLSSADRNLATALVLGVLRWQIALDARVRPFFQRPDVKLTAPVQIALRLGAFQLLHLDRIPAHAALSESVELVRADAPFAVGMVNAVLRKLSTAQKPGERLHESAAAFAERLGHPLWLVERWVAAYGRDSAMAICESDQREPGCSGLFAPEVDGVEMPVMDDGSRLVAELAAACAPEAKRVWDCCAAPGGKTLVMARRFADAELLATDASPRRLRGLVERLEAAGVGERVRAVAADAAALPEELGEFDLILCDVPCSGTGTLGRNPEIRHRVSVEEIKRQVTRQGEILAAAFKRLAPGGRLVYSTCSLEREENEQVVAGVVAGLAGFERVGVRPLIESLRVHGRLRAEVDIAKIVNGDVMRTLPGNGFDGDGFFAAVFERWKS
ncbi:MAG: methyltransferase domain-containing protein [Acidobacteriota bacterium]|nr:methyltransferase domain-containing protein [Acidobacteriota bacterium]